LFYSIANIGGPKVEDGISDMFRMIVQKL